jgi:pyridoxine kinase
MCNVLSIQSWVVHGKVGNSCAVFPLQLLGHDVDPLLTVMFSNHPMYSKGYKGERFSGAQLDALLQGLADNDILAKYNAILTGYVGSVDSLPVIAKWISTVIKPTAGLYLLDPVMGDDSKLYVPSGFVELYKTLLCPLADIITPNWFEAE